MSITINKFGFYSSETSVVSLDEKLTENARIEKWTKMLSNWTKYKNRRASKLKRRVRKGIPSSLRGQIWYRISDAGSIRNNFPESYYRTLLDSKQTLPDSDAIECDISRTFATHVMFQRGVGQSSLQRVLRAYALFDPEVGYTQGMSYVAAMFLLYLTEEDSFWMLVTVMTQYRQRLCFLPGIPKVYSSFYVANALLSKNLPKLWKHLNTIELSTSMFATQWFMTVFCVNFKIDTVVRIWDAFLFEGQKIVYRVYLGVFKLSYKQLLGASFEKTMEVLRTIGQNLDTNSLLLTSFSVSLKTKTINRLQQEYYNNPKQKFVNWVVIKH